MDVTLTHRQKRALYNLVKGVREDDLKQQTLGGYAGTGKTTLIRYLTQFFPGYGICAYTGKAANVLRKKGMFASTIHSRIYEPHFEHGTVYFDLKTDPGCDGFIVDEASMVSKDIYDDLKLFDLPMIFVGDHGQLEPIDDRFNLMAEPDYKLEEIHRNAGHIAQYAHHLRQGLAARGWPINKRGEGVDLLGAKSLTDSMLADADQVICAYNKTRVAINRQIRDHLGHTGLLNVGERVMCLRNEKSQGLFNGMQGTVARLYKKKKRSYMDFEFDGDIIEGVCYSEKYFGEEKYNLQYGGQNSPNPFDYAYCITAHKAQGDEWDNVLVIEQKCKMWDHKRWAYTAASRAREWLGWVLA